jgi:alanine racemase
MSGPRALIDSSALRHNLVVARSRAPHSKIMAVIKANGYGHGIVPTARALMSADAFGVARLSEALAIREHGLGQRIVLLEGVYSSDELNAVAEHGLETVVHSFEQLEMLKAWRGNRQVHVWLKIDTGMNRLGFRVGDFAEAWRQTVECVSIAAMPRLMTHLSSADDAESQATREQLSKFHRIADTLGLERSAANSAGLLAWADARMEWVRPGLMLYGISPFANEPCHKFDLLPAMTLRTTLIAVREVKAGETVGYGGAWLAPHDVRVGIAAIGYGDGYPRQLGSGTPVLVQPNCECTIVGRVSMDMIAIDLTCAPLAAVGDEVTLWGGGLSVERIATCADTIPYELVCGISQRVSVEYQ